MQTIPREQVRKRLETENPWWKAPHTIRPSYSALRPQAYFELFLPLLQETQVKRAILLMGPRRVGKTVLVMHAIRALIEDGVDPRHICYVSVDHPIYNGLGLEELLDDYFQATSTKADRSQRFVFFDEIQYLRNWEIHLKTLVDSHAHIRFVGSGSAAAALRLKSQESGAGRFTDFLLPPLTFYEYLDLLGKTALVGPRDPVTRLFNTTTDIGQLNDSFIHYLNFGGYPEVIFSELIQSDPARFIKGDIVDKVLLRDLPSLYGIQDVQELNHLFTTLAYNSAQEVSLEQISKNSGVAKNTIKRYIEYLEAAFLLKVVHRLDRNGKRFQRANFFKVYLTNPSIRSALFAPFDADDPSVGAMAETGIFSQWFHHSDARYYARWDGGEVDIVSLDQGQKPRWAVEVKWSDRFVERPSELKSLAQFCKATGLSKVTATSRTLSAVREVQGVSVRFVPASIYCYAVGYNLIHLKNP